MENSKNEYCKMIKHHITEIMDKSVEYGELNRESVYNMFLLTSTMKNLYKLEKYSDVSEDDKILHIMNEMRETYLDWKKAKQMNTETPEETVNKITHLIELHKKIVDEVGKEKISEGERDALKKIASYIN